MQLINIVVVNPPVETVLFGSCLAGLAATVLARSMPQTRYRISAATIVDFVGVAIVTMIFNAQRRAPDCRGWRRRGAAVPGLRRHLDGMEPRPHGGWAAGLGPGGNRVADATRLNETV